MYISLYRMDRLSLHSKHRLVTMAMRQTDAALYLLGNNCNAEYKDKVHMYMLHMSVYYCIIVMYMYVLLNEINI